MRKYLPFLIGGLGLTFIGMSLLLRNGSPDTHTAITNLASTFMGVAGAICFLGGVVTFFLRDNEEIW
jgi:hypothetical protein